MGICCSCKTPRIRTIRTTIRLRSAPTSDQAISTTEPHQSPDSSDISCNFTYDDNDLKKEVTAALVVVLLSIQDEYDICCICRDNVSTIKTTTCNHSILCSKCYMMFCTTDLKTCPICRGKLNSDNPFI